MVFLLNANLNAIGLWTGNLCIDFRSGEKCDQVEKWQENFHVAYGSK